jgi:hypothetical protein
MLEQCKLKSEDYDKFKRDQIDAEVLEKKKAISRKTIRSKAAQTIEKISGNFSHFLIILFRKVLEGCIYYPERTS